MVDTAGASHRYYCFGPFRLDTSRQQLYKGGEPVELPRRLVRTLQLLVENHGKDLDKTYLMEQLWPNTVVEEHNLTVIISMLRKVLGDDPEHKKYILTNPGRGYRFLAEVTETAPDEPHPREAVEASGTAAESAVSQRPSPTHLIRRYISLPLVCLAAALLALALFGIHEWTRGKVTQSIAVLPFKPTGPEPDDGFLGLGMADGLIARLRNIRHVVVRPTAEVTKYQSMAHDPLALGKQLQVASLLDGTVQRTGDQIWLRVKLLRTKDGATLWSDEYRGKFADILTLQDQIAEQVTRALALKLDSAEQRGIHRHYTGSSDAYEKYIVGRHHCSEISSARSLEKGVSYFEQAIASDPGFALAYVSLASCYVNLAGHSDTRALPTEIFPKAEAAARRALEIDGTLQEAFLPLALTKAYGDWDFPGAERAFRTSIDLEPEDSEACLAYAKFLLSQERFQEAEHEVQRAAELDPFAWDVKRVTNEVYFFSRRYQEAAEGWQAIPELDLDEAGWYLGWIYASKGRPIPMIEDLLQAEARSEDKGPFVAELAYLYALKGMKPVAESYLQKLSKYADERDDYDVSLVYVALGDRDKAFDLLARARDRHSWDIPYLKVDPRLDSLRSDPRFTELLRSVHLSP